MSHKISRLRNIPILHTLILDIGCDKLDLNMIEILSKEFIKWLSIIKNLRNLEIRLIDIEKEIFFDKIKIMNLFKNNEKINKFFWIKFSILDKDCMFNDSIYFYKKYG